MGNDETDRVWTEIFATDVVVINLSINHKAPLKMTLEGLQKRIKMILLLYWTLPLRRYFTSIILYLEPKESEEDFKGIRFMDIYQHYPDIIALEGIIMELYWILL